MKGECDDDMVDRLSENFVRRSFIGVNTHGVRWAFDIIGADEGSRLQY